MMPHPPENRPDWHINQGHCRYHQKGYFWLPGLRPQCGQRPQGPRPQIERLKGLLPLYVYPGHKLTVNPTENISLGTPQKALPKYLTENEAVELLKNIQSDFYERDYCIITLFLNCGMRLAELVTIDLSDFRDDTIRIVGKGNKERAGLPERCLLIFLAAL